MMPSPEGVRDVEYLDKEQTLMCSKLYLRLG